MYRRFMLLGLALAAIVLTVGGYAVAQDSSTPTAAGTPTDLDCATPVSGIPGTPVAGVTPRASEQCGTPAASTPGADSGATDAAVVNVEMVDIAFNPSTLTIPADTDVTFHIVNNGAAVHNFMIDDPEIFSGDLSGGQSVDLTVNLPAGTYKFYCTIPGHEAAGMVGQLTVQ